MLPIKFYLIGCAWLLVTVLPAISEDNCIEKGMELKCLDAVEDLIVKTNALLPNCTDGCESDAKCGDKDKVTAYLNLAKKILLEARNNYPTCRGIRDCWDVLRSGRNESGVYTIRPDNPMFSNRTLEVFCDMETEGGGWTVVQRRGNFTPQEDFYRTWNVYKDGFGNLEKDFWIGNDNLYALTNQGKYRIRFELESYEGEEAFAEYDSFRIEDEKANYRLRIGKYYKGNAGNSMMFTDELLFSTRDRDNDKLPFGNCAMNGRGGWWYDNCGGCNPNGEYGPAKNDTLADRNRRIYWYMFKRYNALAATEIKIKLAD